jgi:uncharacterized membrane protein YdjX (TVP38/TMEM64 family)
MLIVGLVVVVALGVFFGKDIIRDFSDLEQIKTVVAGLGPLAPLGFIAMNAVQIVVAPIPATLLQLAAGYLFGVWLGALYSTAGMTIGAVAAFLLARRFGVHLIQRFVPQRFLQPWLRVRNLNSTTLWVAVLLLPVGDFVYYMAGLTALSLPRMIVTAIIVRSPSVVLTTLAGAKVMSIPPILWPVIAVAVLGAAALVVWQRDRLQTLVFDRAINRLERQQEEKNGPEDYRDHP